jgi:hypothetical protein
MRSSPGLPDGLFSYQNSQFGYILKALGWKTLVNSTAIWNLHCHFAIFLGHVWHFYCQFGIFFSFGLLYQKQSGNPALRLSTTMKVGWLSVFPYFPYVDSCGEVIS